MIEELTVNLRILARAEMTLLRADANRRTNRLLLSVLSIGCVLVALVFVNLGAFFLLTDADGDARAAFILAGVNLAIGAIPFLVGRSSKPSAEEEMVREIREMAAAEISRDVKQVSDELGAVSASVKQVQAGISGLGSGSGTAIAALGPLVPLLIDLLKKSKKH